MLVKKVVEQRLYGIFQTATHVQLPTLNWMGHVVAPDAKIEQQDGNYNGTLIGKEVKTSGEGHKYWYNGGKLISDDVGFFAKKSFRIRYLAGWHGI